MRWLFVLVLTVTAAGCSDTFDPFVDEADGFAIYGFLDARAGTQAARVQPIADRETEPQLGDARLTSTRLGDGTARVWQDALVTLDDGSVGLLFTADFQPEAGEVYRLDVESAGGAVQRVDVPLPMQPSLSPQNPVNITGTVSQRVVIDSRTPPQAVVVVYRARRIGGAVQEVGLSKNAEPISSGPGYDVLVPLSRDGVQVRGSLGADQDEPIELLGLRLRYELEERVEVPGGFGEIGTAAAFETGWTLPPETIEALNYIDRQGEER